MPKISIIVPVYNVERYLCRCVDSILKQSFTDFELVLVDDGSPDNCGAICDSYAVKDNRVHVIHQENAGVSAARNAGIEWALNSNSRWIAFLDSDDWIHKKYIETLITVAEGTGVMIAACLPLCVEDYCEDALLKSEVEMMMPEDSMVQYPTIGAACWGKIISKQLFEQLRFPVGIRYEDAWIMHLVIMAANQIAVCKEPMYYYYNNPQSFTRDIWSTERMSIIAVHDRRLAYFKENGYRKAWEKEIELFLADLILCLQALMWEKQNNAQYEKQFNKIRDVLRVILHTARTECGLKLKKDNMWAFFFALPTDVLWKLAKHTQRIYHQMKQ